MDKITPGRKLIFDLLAKSIAKILASSSEAVNKKEKDDASAEDIPELHNRRPESEHSETDAPFTASNKKEATSK